MTRQQNTWQFRTRVSQQRSKNDDHDQQHEKNHANYNDLCFAHKYAGSYFCNKTLCTHLFIRKGYKIERLSRSETSATQRIGDPQDLYLIKLHKRFFQRGRGREETWRGWGKAILGAPEPRAASLKIIVINGSMIPAKKSKTGHKFRGFSKSLLPTVYRSL